jgi:precorrin-6A/cobalt-precorrin-6A reductase
MQSPAAALRILIIGGTSEAMELAGLLAAKPEFAVISSLAGRTTQPKLPAGEVRIGPFGGVAGLVEFLSVREIDLVVDASHPFAARISGNAAQACQLSGVPLLVVERPPWERVEKDLWYEAADMQAAARLAAQLGTRVFLTVGRQDLTPFAGFPDRWFLIRSIEVPADPLPLQHELLLDRGPFAADEEMALLRGHGIDVVVSKNSGGPATYSKIIAARELQIPVVLVQRPVRAVTCRVSNAAEALAWIFAAY